MTDLVQRLRSVDSEYGLQLAAVAADRIEQLEDEAGQLREQNTYLDGVVAKLEKRLEISPRTKYDGIDCRDETIRQLERENAFNQEIMREKHRAALGFLQRIAHLEDENAELRQKLASVPLTQFPQSFRDDLAEAIRLGKVIIS